MVEAEENGVSKNKPVPRQLTACSKCGSLVERPSPEALRQMRRDAGLTLREFAERQGLSAAYLCDIEHGNRNCTPAIEVAYVSLKKGRA